MTASPALAILELRSIARGYVALDAACKRAVVELVRAEPISPGKYWLALRGGEAEVEEALGAAVDAAGEARLDHTLLAAAHPALLDALLRGAIPRPALDAVGALELGSISAAVRAADAALKAAAVALVDLHLARGIGGKGYLVLTGDLGDVEAAVDAGAEAAGEAWLEGREVIANPDPMVGQAVGRGR
jgi:microcompartment protein CcmL/EutN